MDGCCRCHHTAYTSPCPPSLLHTTSTYFCARRIVEFAEKPKGDALRAMQVDTTLLGLDAETAKSQPYIASMGIYVCKAQALRVRLAGWPAG